MWCRSCVGCFPLPMRQAVLLRSTGRSLAWLLRRRMEEGPVSSRTVGRSWRGVASGFKCRQAGRQARPGCLGVRLSSWGCVWRQRAIRLNFFWLREAFPRLHRPWPPLRTQKAWASALPTHWWNILRGTSCGVQMALACHPVIAGAPSPLRPRSNPARQPRQRGLELVSWGASRGAWRSL